MKRQKIGYSKQFTEPLPEFCKRRIVCWHVEDSEFSGAVDGLSLPAVTVLKLSGKTAFA
jgi:hypothetical protein